MSLAPGLEAQAAAKTEVQLPRRGSSGKTGVEITLLEQGAVRAWQTGSSGSPLRAASASSTPPRSTAPSRTSRSGSSSTPAIRKQIFLVTKDMPRTPTESAEDGRRAAGDPGDRLHRPLLHPRPGRRLRRSTSPIELVKSQEFKKTADTIRKSGKAKFIGFSTHHKNRAQLIQAAAEAGSSTRSCSSTAPGSTRTRR